jgi:CopA family copper-resistance protein
MIRIFFILKSLILGSLFFSSYSYAKIVEYNLNSTYHDVNFSGKKTCALALNNSIPGPTLKATVGDILRVKFTNNLDIETSIHWHGVLVPNNMDGVPYVNSPPIKPKETFTYEFPIKHSGTYWYHAHSALQEQQGVYGSLVFYPKNEVKDYDEEHVVVLSDWIDENPDQVLANLKKDADYYALKKDSVQSWLKILENGLDAVKIRVKNAWTRMGPMDMSDIGYDAFLINGKKSSILTHAKPGSRIKLRIINAAASSYFVFEYSGGTMKIVESDGVKVSPFTAQRIRISMAETYDIIITVPDNKTYEFKASAEDGTGYAVTHIGQGNLVTAPIYPKPNLVLMDMGGMDHGGMGGAIGMDSMNMSMSNHISTDKPDASGMEHSKHKEINEKNELNPKRQASRTNKESKEIHKMQENSMVQNMNMPSSSANSNATMVMDNSSKHKMSNMDNMSHAGMESMKDSKSSNIKRKSSSSVKNDKHLPHVDYLNNYKLVKSPTITTLPQNNSKRIVTLKLTGSMERYVWTINDTPMYAADKIMIKKGENVKFILVNETMMNHPIHLHGHFFRVLNGQGAYSPLKHTVNVSPFETVEIEFEANEEKDWIFHCHNLYHMKLGMGGIVHYEGTEHDPILAKHAADHSSEHGNVWFNAVKIEGYSNFALATAKLTRNDDNFIADFRHNYKNNYEGELIYQRYISRFLGLYIGGKFESEDGKASNLGVLGLEYMLPLLIKVDLRINTNRKLRFGISNEHQITDRMSLDWQWNTDKEYALSVSYVFTKQFYISGNYDSREKIGIGLVFKF